MTRRVAVRPGDGNDPATWSGAVPDDGDTVVIDHAVTLSDGARGQDAPVASD